jgi:hypothetical protein
MVEFGYMSMSIGELHTAIELAAIKLTIFSMQSNQNDDHSFARPAYIESLLKDPLLPKNFGESFDEIMSPQYRLEDARVNIRLTEIGRTQPDFALLSARSLLQHFAVIALIEDAKQWIENTNKSFKHQGNLGASRNGARNLEIVPF